MVQTTKQARADLESPDTKTRIVAIHKLKRHPGKANWTAIVSAMEDPEGWVRATAALAIGQSEIAPGRQTLLDHVFDDPVDHVRLTCMMSLHSVDPTGFMPVFIQALSDSSPRVVGFACIALGKFRHPDAMAALKEMLTYPVWIARLHACSSLVTLECVDAEVIACLEQLNVSPEAAEHNAEARKVNAIGQEIDGPNAERIMDVTDDVLEDARRLLL